jgi:GNAT superfamily N-acetyltransferase
MGRGTWTIRPYRPGDEEAIVGLFAYTFGRPITTAHWLWKLRGYEPPPFENVWLALDHEKVIFHFGGIPVRILTSNGIRWAVLSVDAMTHPEYRRRGLLTNVAAEAFACWRDAGALLTYGLPNEKSARVLDALGFKHAFEVRWRRRLIRPFRTLARRSTINIPTALLDSLWHVSKSMSDPQRTDIELIEAKEADGCFDQIYQRYTSDRILTFVRDRDWIRWRYFLAPQSGYRVLVARQANESYGYVAYRMRNTTGLIAEVVSPNDLVSFALMRGAIEHLKVLGAESVSTLAIPESPYDQQFNRIGFSRSKSFGFGVLPLTPDVSREFVNDPRSWHLLGGDFDVV